jgi:dTDP-4-amino-4,6-dideoxygalactose transaminase
LAARMRRLREHGMSVSAADRHAAGRPVVEQYLETGFNYRMTDLQAAVGIVQLGRLPGMVARRRELATRYHELLAAVRGVRAVHDPAYGTTNYQAFWVELPERVGQGDVLAALAASGVSARRGIMAAHLEPAYADAAHVPLPVTERLTRRTVILPLHHELASWQQDLVVQTLVAAIGAVPTSATV